MRLATRCFQELCFQRNARGENSFKILLLGGIAEATTFRFSL
jgi:hypothetical protein